MARSLIFKAKNTTGATVSSGAVVYVSGFDVDDGNSTFSIASANLENKMPAVGIVDSNILNNQVGNIRIAGLISGFDTRGRSVNDPVYVGLNGEVLFTNPKDINSNYAVQQIGIVAKVDEDPNGLILLLPLEIRENIKHADKHVPGEDDEFIHASQHEVGGQDTLSHSKLSDLDVDAHEQYPTFSNSAATRLTYWESARRITGSANLVWDQTNTKLTIGDSSVGQLITPKAMITPEGGFAIKLTNNTGNATVKGNVVQASNAVDDAFKLQDDQVEAIGIVYEAGVADGDAAWIVIAGIAQVLLEDNTGASKANWVYASTEDGMANATLSAPSASADEHFKEIGHAIEDVSAGGLGTNVLAKIIVHFN